MASKRQNSGHHPVYAVTVQDEWNPNIIITSPLIPFLGKKFSFRNTTILYTDDGLMLQHPLYISQDNFFKRMSQDFNGVVKQK
jgi:hypothetical protein